MLIKYASLASWAAVSIKYGSSSVPVPPAKESAYLPDDVHVPEVFVGAFLVISFSEGVESPPPVTIADRGV